MIRNRIQCHARVALQEKVSLELRKREIGDAMAAHFLPDEAHREGDDLE